MERLNIHLLKEWLFAVAIFNPMKDQQVCPKCKEVFGDKEALIHHKNIVHDAKKAMIILKA
jgi:hypothetical protein